MDTNVLYEIVEKAKKYDELLKIQREFTLNCSFCGKRQEDVNKLVAGNNVFICDECIELCYEIVNDTVEIKAKEENE